MKKIILTILTVIILIGCTSLDERERISRNSGDIPWNKRLIFMFNGYRSINRGVIEEE